MHCLPAGWKEQLTQLRYLCKPIISFSFLVIVFFVSAHVKDKKSLPFETTRKDMRWKVGERTSMVAFSLIGSGTLLISLLLGYERWNGTDLNGQRRVNASAFSLITSPKPSNTKKE